MGKLYDVILFGVQEGKEQGDVARAIAESFSLAPEKAELLFEKQCATLIKKEVPLEVAERYHAALVKAGAKCNYKPSVCDEDKLGLIPKDKPTFVCPECGYSVELEEGEPHPSVCDQCGLVFDKYRVAQKRKREEEALRKRLEKLQEAREEEEAKRKQREEEDLRRRKLEEEIRKELGLPSLVNSRSRLWGSAAATLVLGIGIGALGAGLLLSESDRIEASAPLAMEQSPEAMESVISGIAGTSQDLSAEAEQEARKQLEALSQEIEQAVIADTVGDAPAPEAGVSGSPTATGEPPEAPEIRSTPKVDEMALEALRRMGDEDAEWDSFIQDIVQTRLEADALPEARRLAERVRAPLTRYLAQAQVAAGYIRIEQPDKADELLGEIVRNLETTSTGARRVELLTAIAPVLAENEMSVTATHVMKKATNWAGDLEAADERAASWARIGWAQAQLGLPVEARNSIRRAATALQESAAEEQRVRVTSRLAEVFARLGAQKDAQRILESAQVAAERIDQPAARDLAVEAVASSWVHIGDLERGVHISEELSTSTERDRFLFALLQHRVFSGQHFGLSSVAEMIAAPQRRARAYALLGRTNTSLRIASDQFEQAIAISNELDKALDQVLVQGEIARFLTRSDNKEAGVLLFVEAEEKLHELTPGSNRDIGWARLAENRARAIELDKAEGYLNLVESPRVIEVAREDLARVSQTLEAM